MSKTSIAILALLLAGVSAGFALCMSLVHYATWELFHQTRSESFKKLQVYELCQSLSHLEFPVWC